MTSALLHPAEIFHLLHGTWHLDRTTPGHATMQGTVTFTLVPQSRRPPVAPNVPSALPLIDLSSRPKAASRPQWRDLHSPSATIHASQAEAGTTALYTEEVQIHTTAGAHLTGTAHYLFSRRPDGDLDVHLPATGALFHTLNFLVQLDGSLQARATHLCAADTYTSTYRLLTPDHLTIEHIVRGPRKHYTTQTTLTRTTKPAST